MDVEEILSKLERGEGRLPRNALEEASAHRDGIIPRLLGVLEEVARDPRDFVADKDRMIHIYAMYLLAQFREPRAYPLLVKIFSVPGELPFELAGDVVTQDLGRILASVSDGDPGGMMALVENKLANGFVRDAALDGLVTLVACGWRTRDEVMAYFSRLFHALERTPSQVWNGLANSCTDLCPVEVAADLRQAYEEGLIDSTNICWEDIQEALDKGQKSALKEAQRRNRLITNTADEIRWMAGFHEDSEEREDELQRIDEPEEVDGDADSSYPLLGPEPDFPEPYRRTEPKIGRNDPCPCGSGKKYKKCCAR